MLGQAGGDAAERLDDGGNDARPLRKDCVVVRAAHRPNPADAGAVPERPITRAAATAASPDLDFVLLAGVAESILVAHRGRCAAFLLTALALAPRERQGRGYLDLVEAVAVRVVVAFELSQVDDGARVEHLRFLRLGLVAEDNRAHGDGRDRAPHRTQGAVVAAVVLGVVGEAEAPTVDGKAVALLHVVEGLGRGDVEASLELEGHLEIGGAEQVGERAVGGTLVNRARAELRVADEPDLLAELDRTRLLPVGLLGG